MKNDGQILVENISQVKMEITKNSVFASVEKLEEYLSKFTFEQRFEKYAKASRDLNDLLSANIRELHENLEIFYSNEEELSQARKSANLEFNTHMDGIYRSKMMTEIINNQNERARLEKVERDRFITVEDKQYEVVKKIEVLWCGWECDEYAYAVKTDTGIKLVISDHGTKLFAKSNFLEERINAYKSAMTETEEMLKLITS